MAITRVRRYVREGEGYTAWRDINSWLLENYGIPGAGGGQQWYYDTKDEYMDFYFVDPYAADIFILKWM